MNYDMMILIANELLSFLDSTLILNKNFAIKDADKKGSTKSACPFDSTDVDYVASISFNYGLSLMDISQVEKH